MDDNADNEKSGYLDIAAHTEPAQESDIPVPFNPVDQQQQLPTQEADSQAQYESVENAEALQPSATVEATASEHEEDEISFFP